MNEFRWVQKGNNNSGSANCDDFYDKTKATYYYAFNPINCIANYGWLYFETVPFRDEGYGIQFCRGMQATVIAYRILNNNVWSAWVEFATKNDLNPYLKVITVPVADGNSYSVPLESLPQGVYLVHLCYLYNSWQQVYLGMLMNYSTDNRDLIPICNNPSFPVAVTVNNSQIDCNSILSSAKFIQLGYW